MFEIPLHYFTHAVLFSLNAFVIYIVSFATGLPVTNGGTGIVCFSLSLSVSLVSFFTHYLFARHKMLFRSPKVFALRIFCGYLILVALFFFFKSHDMHQLAVTHS